MFWIHLNILNFEGLEFTMKTKDMTKFEKPNELNLNVFELNRTFHEWEFADGKRSNKYDIWACCDNMHQQDIPIRKYVDKKD